MKDRKVYHEKALLYFCFDPDGLHHPDRDRSGHSEILPARYYRQYILLFRLRTAGAGAASTVTAEFAGVLDPRGNSIIAARQGLKE